MPRTKAVEPPSALHQLISRKELARLLGYTVRTIDRMANQPGFPRPIRRGHSVRYVEAEVAAFIEQQRSTY